RVLVVVLPVEVCHGVGTILVVWWYLVVVGGEVEAMRDLLRLTPLQFFSGFTIGVAYGGVVADLYHQQ
ncbi:hypothetical protein Taro_055913, partial [Colocasia esculenta]|nr:hypothetical protein [Colocasia esculenta]